MNISPVNRMLVIHPTPSSTTEKESILVPDDYRPMQPHAVGTVLAISGDCKISVKKNDTIVYDNSMLQEVKVDGSTTYLLLENYVMAVLNNE